MVSLNTVLDEIDDSGGFVADSDNTTATRIGICNTEDAGPVTQQLMGYSYKIGDKVIRIGASPHPFIPGLRVRSVKADPIGKRLSSTWLSGGTTSQMKLTVEYEYPKFDDDQQNPGEEPPTGEDQPEMSLLWCSQALDYSVEIITVPVKARVYIVGSTTSAWSEQIVKKTIRIPMVAYTVTYERVPKPPWADIISLVGKVNEIPIFGGPPGTVLFDGAHADRQIGRGPDFQKSNKIWKLSYKFLYHPKGWNKVIHPETLEWVDVQAMVDAGKVCYESGNLKELFVGAQ